MTHSVDGFLEDLESNNERTPSIPPSFSKLGNILIISNETRISLPGNLLISSIKSNKYDASFIIRL